MIEGSGSSGGGSPRTPVESPDSLVNISYAKILDILSEGEIVGIVGGLEGVFLDETPVMTNGVMNFNNIDFDERKGTQSQDFMPGFPQVESTINVGVELTQSTPYQRSVTNPEVDALRINIQVPAFSKQIMEGKTQGDVVGIRVAYAIDVDDGSGIYTQVAGGALDGKASSSYQRSIRVNLPKTGGTRRVRVRRITANSTASNVIDTTNIASVTEIIDAKFRYPNTAYVGIRFDAQTFGGQIPSRSYLAMGRIIRVPNNYDPVSRLYDGVWQGDFKLAYTNNPAWVFLDLLLNTRYGLGEYITEAQIDKWSLYDISQYCDQMVDDGKGGLEPRFACNCYLQTRADALKVLQDLASIFRGITYWGAGQAYVSADMPRDSVYTYTNANVIDGKFSYKGSRRNTRYSAAIVGWNDPESRYKIKTEYVENTHALSQTFQYNTVNLTAFGCTSQGQAIRLGKSILLTNTLETQVVAFATGLEGLRCKPGDVITIADNNRAGRRIGGRIISSTLTTITCDRIDDSFTSGSINVHMPDATVVNRDVLSVSGNVITLADELPSLPLPMSIFSLESDDVETQLFRVLSVGDNGDNTYTFSCAKHVPDKYDNIESGVILSERPISVLPLSFQPPPQNLTIESEYLIDQYQAVNKFTAKWEKADGAIKYALEWRRDNNNWTFAGETYNTEIDVFNIFSGVYDVRVKAISPNNKHSIWTELNGVELEGKDENTAQVINLRTESQIMAIGVKWSFPDGVTDTAYTELEYSLTASGSSPTAIRISYPTDEYVHGGMGSAKTMFFRARLIDKSGNIGPWTSWVSGQSSADADEILDYLTGQISISLLNQELTNEIGQIPSLVENQGDMQQSIIDLFDDMDAANQELVDLSQSIANLDGDITGIESILNQHGIDINTLFNTDQNLEDQINDLQAQIADVLSAPEYDPAETYLEGIIVKFDGSLYRALQNVPLGINPTNAAYWEKIGDYDSLGEVVSSLVVRMGSAESDIDGLDGRVSTNANDILALDSRVIDAEGGLEANSQAIESLETSVDIIGDQVTAQSQSVSYLQSSLRDITDYNGYLEDVLNEHDSFAMIREVRTTVVTNEKSQATINLSVQTRFNENEAAFNQEVMTRSDADSALSVRIDSLAARTSSTESAIVNESNIRANADTALANQITTIQSQINDPSTGLPGVVALINAEASTRASADSALSTQITNLSATVTGLDGEIQDAFSAIQNEASARADADGALANQISNVQAVANSKNKTYRQDSAPTAGMASGDIWYDSDDNDKLYRYSGTAWVATDDKRIAQNTSAIQTEATARADGDSALATQITNLSAEISDIDDQVQANAGAIDQIEVEVETIEGMIQSNASQTMFLYSQYRDQDENGYLEDVLNGHDSFAAVREVRRAFSNESKSQASINLTVSARLNNNESMINSESLARSTADDALASDINTVAAMVNDPSTGLPATFAAIQSEATTRANADTALSTQINTVQSQVNDPDTGLLAVAGAISNEATVRANADGALSNQISTVQSQVNDPDTGLSALSTSIQTVSQTVLDINGDISATYAVKLQQNVGGVITFAGFGIGLTNETGVTQSTFLVNADQFAILNDPTGTSATSPFIVTGGQVYIRDAVIQIASISFAKIQNDIESSNYVENSQGWKIDKNGTIEINGNQSGTGRVSITNTAFRVYNSSGIAVVELGIL